jgi:hypothetical protein
MFSRVLMICRFASLVVLLLLATLAQVTGCPCESADLNAASCKLRAVYEVFCSTRSVATSIDPVRVNDHRLGGL